ncbi:MAG: sugar ABC transporter substrate-binding protein [Bacillota bacterium]
MRRSRLVVLCALVLTGLFMVGDVALAKMTTINVVSCAGINATVMRRVKDLFEKENPDIKVNVIEIPWSGIQEKQLLELASRKGSYDAVMHTLSFFPQYVVRDYLEPLDKYISNPKLTPKFFQMSDFIPSLVEEGNTYQGKVYGIPFGTFPQLLFYRPDLLEKYNVPVPKTLDEFLVAAEKLTVDENKDGKPEVYGTTIQGMPCGAGGNTWHWYPYLFSFGGSILDAKGRPVLDSKEAVAALEFYKKLYEFSPQEAINYGCDQATGAAQEGNIAMLTQDSDQSQMLLTAPKPYKAALFPAGPSGRHVLVGSWSLSINKMSRNKEATWKFIAYATASPEAMRIYAEEGLIPAKISALTGDLAQLNPVFPLIVETLKGGKGVPKIDAYTKIEDVISVAIPKVLSGQLSPKEALAQANKEISEFLK